MRRALPFDRLAKPAAKTAHKVVTVNEVGVATTACGRRFPIGRLIPVQTGERCRVCEERG